jgi:sigma-B regulation protein RsbU (phosphoserine phosphatase)
LAGWRIGSRTAASAAIASVGLNAVTIYLELNPHGFTKDLLASQALHAIVYGTVAFLSARLRREQQLLKEQSERVERLHSQMAEEMQAARTLQELLSVPPPCHPSVEIGSFNVSLSPEYLAVLVADVSGKGSPAALATAVLLGMLEDCPARFESPAQTLAFLNKRLGNCLPNEMFVTALYLLLNLRTGALTWASAGHESPLLHRMNSDGSRPPRVDELCEDGGSSMPLAIITDDTYEEHRLSLSPGDVLFCYTDGLTDLRLSTGDRLGTERLCTLFAQFAHLPCRDLISAMLLEATGQNEEQLYSGGLDDDLSIIAIRRR